ncbi:MAG: NYN domain-containing protein [Rhodospirillaceae bacterium]|nr:NYN domain-containing protein [Rhodospirillaceae bacterium]
MDERRPGLAVLIDADNTSHKYADAIFEEIAKLGEASVRRIYGDFSGDRLRGWNEVTEKLAILQTQARSNTPGKNASDIALVIDAMDLLYRGHLDGFCLISSDSDFTRLAQRLREQGATVYGFGMRKTPRAFVSACNRFIYVENIIADDGAEPSQSPGAEASTVEAVDLIGKAMAELEDAEGWAHLGAVGSHVSTLAPDFDPRTYGCSKLSTLVEKTGRFEINRSEGKVLIRRKTTRPKSRKKG